MVEADATMGNIKANARVRETNHFLIISFILLGVEQKMVTTIVGVTSGASFRRSWTCLITPGPEGNNSFLQKKIVKLAILPRKFLANQSCFLPLKVRPQGKPPETIEYLFP